MTYPERTAHALRAQGQLSFRGDQDTVVVEIIRPERAEEPPSSLKITRKTAE